MEPLLPFACVRLFSQSLSVVFFYELRIPPFPVQIRVMFEVQDLRYATLATVSRCGMVWFSEDVLSLDMIFENFLSRLKNISIDEGEEGMGVGKKDALSPTLQVSHPLYVHVSGVVEKIFKENLLGGMEIVFCAYMCQCIDVSVNA